MEQLLDVLEIYHLIGRIRNFQVIKYRQIVPPKSVKLQWMKMKLTMYKLNNLYFENKETGYMSLKKLLRKES